MTSVRAIRNHLLRTYGIRYMHNRSAIYYGLRVRLGYRYAKPKSRCIIITEKRRQRLRKYWLQRDLALKMQASFRNPKRREDVVFAERGKGCSSRTTNLPTTDRVRHLEAHRLKR